MACLFLTCYGLLFLFPNYLSKKVKKTTSSKARQGQSVKAAELYKDAGFPDSIPVQLTEILRYTE